MKHMTQPLRRVNSIPISRGTLELVPSRPTQLAAHIAAGLQIHHPKSHKTLNSALHFSLNKDKGARVIFTIHHGSQTKTVTFSSGMSIKGKKSVKFRTPPDKFLEYALPISIHAYAHRKDSKPGVRLRLIRVDLSS